MSEGDTGGTPTVEEIQVELEKTRAALKAANAESAERRIRLAELERAQDARAAAELGETQKLRADLAEATRVRDELTERVKADRIQTAVLMAATTLGFENPSDAVRLIDLSAVEITADGKVTGFETSLAELAKSGRLPIRGARGDGLGTPLRGGQQATPAEPAPVPTVRL